MKIRLITLLIAVVLISISPATLAFEEENLIVGSGFVMGQLTLDLDELNASLQAADFPKLQSRLIIHGVDAEVGQIDGFRLGGFGFGNAATAVSGDRISKLSISYGGITPSYTFARDSLYELSVGAMIGGGRATLMMLDRASQDFADSLTQFHQTHLRRSFALLQPYLGLTLPIGKWLNLRISAGYFFTLLADWEQHGVALPGPPDSLNSFIVQASIEIAWRGDR